MINNKRIISLIVILSFPGFISNAFAQKSYRRVFPASPSPKPGIIQERDSRQEMQAELKQEQQEQLSQQELDHLIKTGRESKDTEALIKEGDRLYSEGKYNEASKFYDAAYSLYEQKTKPHGSQPSQIYYKISIGDKLYISVWRVPDLSLEFTVGPDGYISFPLVGDVYAYGRALSQLDNEITETLKEYVVDPQVSVMVREFAGDKVTVIGEVRSPGIYKFVRKTNLIDVVALAHGFTDRAKVVNVAIIRETGNPNEDPELIVINAKDILKGNLRNFPVEPNDIVYVSRTFVSNFKEFYNDWVAPILGTAMDTMIDYETFMALRRTRLN